MKIVPLPSAERFADVETILDDAQKNVENIAGLIVCGMNKEGNDFMFSTRLSRMEMLWISERLRRHAMTADF